ncbi:MAG: hypothetical protein IAF58_15535 [Leptolyngbya sp.]|nr:hypothetical protein [Candidatus Melainabacteria bacterium]
MERSVVADTSKTQDKSSPLSVEAWSQPEQVETPKSFTLTADRPKGERNPRSLDTSTDNLYASIHGGEIQTASLGRPNERIDGKDGREAEKPSGETFERLSKVYMGLAKGDTYEMQTYLRDMNLENRFNPAKGKDMQNGLTLLNGELKKLGIEGRSEDGHYSLSLKDAKGNEQKLSFNPRGTIEGGSDRQTFNKSLRDKLSVGVQKDDPSIPFSDKMYDRLDSIQNGIKNNNIDGLTGAIKEISEKVHSVKPGKAGAAERKGASDLKDVLDGTAYDLSRENVHAHYDRQNGNFSISLPNDRGGSDSLSIDKYGRPSLSGPKLDEFMKRLNKNLKVEPTISI